MKHCCVIVGGLAEDEGRGQLERDTGGGIALVPQAQRQSTEWRQEDLAQLGRPWHIQSLEWSRAVEEELEAECGRQGEAAEDGGEETTMCALHSSKKKRACFRSQGGRIRRWDKTGQPIAGTGRGRPPSPQASRMQEPAGEMVHGKGITGTAPPAGSPVSSSWVDSGEAAQQKAAQPPAPGEFSHLNTLYVLVDSLSSLVKKLFPKILPLFPLSLQPNKLYLLLCLTLFLPLFLSLILLACYSSTAQMPW